MEEKTIKKFKSHEDVKDKFNKRSIWPIIGILGFLVSIIYFINELDNLYAWQQDEKNMGYFFIAICIAGIVGTWYDIKRLGVIQGNLIKNTLEIKESYISGIYTEKPKSEDDDKHFKIGYSHIERLEVKEPNFLTEYHNLYIYHTDGLVKLTIESPDEASALIKKGCEKELTGITEKPYACQCGNIVHYGDAECPQCSRKFDWTKL